jgi:serine/threonine-protein kinase
VLGTADYMSPEQTDGRNVTEKCDQYSLGGVMYTLLAGRTPFRAKSLPEMLQLQRFAEPEPVRRFAPETPPQFEKMIMQILSKEPGDRFPNVLVLARHMEAMRRALSRPEPDDFALFVDAPQPASVSDVDYEAIAQDTTRIEPLGNAPPAPPIRPARGLGEAPSAGPLAGPAHRDATQRGTDVTGPFTSDFGSDANEELELSPPEVRAGEHTSAYPSASAAEALRPRTRFRAVDEDLLPPPDAAAPSRLAFAAQIAGLVAALALLTAGVWYFSRPATAADLYGDIAEVAELGRIESLRAVEDEITEFLERFPQSEHAAEVAGYQEEIALSRLEDRLHRRARRRLGPQSLAPIEQMYLDAIARSDEHPSQAIADLKAIATLYAADSRKSSQEPGNGEGASTSSPGSPAAPDDLEFNSRVQDCLRLIERRLARLERSAQIEADRQLPVLHRRLDLARRLESEDPARARSLYQAIIQLGQGKPWADPVVREAVKSLRGLDDASDQAIGSQHRDEADARPDETSP